MASFSGDSSAETLGTKHQTESTEKLKHELSKQALGLNGDIRLAFQSNKNSNQNGSKGDSKSVFALHESLLDDEFDDVIDGNSGTSTSAKDVASSPTPFVIDSKDINEINRIWNQKKETWKTDERDQPGKGDALHSSDSKLVWNEGTKSPTVSAISLAEQIATSKAGLMYKAEAPIQGETESGMFHGLLETENSFIHFLV